MSKNKIVKFFESEEGQELVDVSEIFLDMILDEVTTMDEIGHEKGYQLERSGYTYNVFMSKLNSEISFLIDREDFALKLYYSYAIQQWTVYSSIWVGSGLRVSTGSPMRKDVKCFLEGVIHRLERITVVFEEKQNKKIDAKDIEERLQNRRENLKNNRILDEFEEIKNRLKGKLGK